MSFPYGRLLGALALSLFILPSAPALAEDADGSVILDRPGAAEELRGLRARVIAFYEVDDGKMKLTMLLSGVGSGGEVLRTSVKLADGQSHALRIPGGRSADLAELFSFVRSGEHVKMAYGAEANFSALTVEEDQVAGLGD